MPSVRIEAYKENNYTGRVNFFNLVLMKCGKYELGCAGQPWDARLRHTHGCRDGEARQETNTNRIPMWSLISPLFRDRESVAVYQPLPVSEMHPSSEILFF